MRYDKGHKEASRKRILEAASRQFRENGIAGTGIASVMTAAGLTNGAFYAHFESKEDLVRQVILAGGDRRNKLFEDAGGTDKTSLEEAIRGYLSPAHRDQPSTGCPVAAYGAEIARHSAKTRAAFSSKIAPFITAIASLLRGDSEQTKLQTATAIYALMVGTMQIARAVPDRALSDEVLESGVRSALSLSTSVRAAS